MSDTRERKPFTGGNWQNEINVRDFILHNFAPYEEDDSFLVGPSFKTRKLWETVSDLMKKGSGQ